MVRRKPLSDWRVRQDLNLIAPANEIKDKGCLGTLHFVLARE